MEYLSPTILMILEHTSNGDLVWTKNEDFADCYTCEELSFFIYASPEAEPLWITDNGYSLNDLETELLRRVIDPQYNEKFTREQLKPYWKQINKEN